MKINDDKLDELFQKSRFQPSEYTYESIEKAFLKSVKTNNFNLKKWFIMSTIAIMIGISSVFYFSDLPNNISINTEEIKELSQPGDKDNIMVSKKIDEIISENIHMDDLKVTKDLVENEFTPSIKENKIGVDDIYKADYVPTEKKTNQLKKSKTPGIDKIIGYHERFHINRNSTEKDLKKIQIQANKDGLFFEYLILKEKDKVGKIFLNLATDKEIGICSSEAAIEFDDNDDAYSFGWDKNDRGEVTKIDIEDTISMSANRFKSTAFSNKQCEADNDEDSQKKHVFYFTRHSSENDFELIKDSAETFGIEMKYKLKEKNSILNKVSLELKFENENTNGAFNYLGTYDDYDNLDKKHYFGWIEDAENNIIEVTIGDEKLVRNNTATMLFNDSLYVTQLTTLEEFENFKTNAATIGLEFTYKAKYDDGKIVAVEVGLKSFDNREKNINCSTKSTSDGGISEFSIGYVLNTEGKVVKVGSNSY